MGLLRPVHRRRLRGVATADAGGVPLPAVLAQTLLAIREREGLSQRRAMTPGVSLPEGAVLRAARQAGLHPAVDPIGQRTRAALECWEQMIGGGLPETVAAWTAGGTASILLAGPLDPAVGVPSQRGNALGLEVTFHQYGRWRDKLHQLVLATVEGNVTASITPDRAWAADGLLVPFGSTRAGAFYLPLLGTSEAGPLSLSGPAAPELLASLLVFAVARVGAGRARAIVYQDLLRYVEGLIDAESFGAADLESLRLRLEDEWKQRAQQISTAQADDLHHYALLPDAESISLLMLLIGPQAATEMGLLNPDWPYVLREAGQKGISIIVWGDVATAPRHVHATGKDATFVLDASAERTEYELPPVQFTPAFLEQDVLAEVAAVLGVGRTSRHQAAGVAPTETAEKAIAEPERAEGDVNALGAELATVVDEAAGRRLYVLGNVRAEFAGSAVEGWRRRRALELLAFLAAHPEGRSADAVLEAIWPEANANRARAQLRQIVREARARLRADKQNAPVVLYRDGAYKLDRGNVWSDIDAFRHAIARSRDADDAEPHLRNAVELYRGEFCKDAYFSWTEPIRHELERLYLDAAIRLVDLLTERENVEEAHRIVEVALTLNPYVDAVVQRALALDACRFGIRAARERVAQFRTRLRQDIDAEPDPSTLAALERVAHRFSGNA